MPPAVVEREWCLLVARRVERKRADEVIQLGLEAAEPWPVAGGAGRDCWVAASLLSELHVQHCKRASSRPALALAEWGFGSGRSH